jgi:Ca2+-binding RTX toxin-like protein
LGPDAEDLFLQGALSINGTGNAGRNTIRGNSGNNRLDGGAGLDLLVGGLGNDIYVVETAGDAVWEHPNAGTDTVESSVSFSLGTDVENLVLTGAAAISGTGNILNNALTGNSANNTLSGGAGADTMAGGLGNDTYVVDNPGDVVTEAVNAGVDTVQSSIAYTLGANLENLMLTGSVALNGTGNTLNNVLTGNDAANVLDGGLGMICINPGYSCLRGAAAIPTI